ncbi:MAG TPA: translation initiation factor IF-2 subunit beta [Nanoarchaeota archaeon]|nr:MAG: translation initiation factor 2 subunit 2 [archaeon GW2011_AR6]MBS3082987.1 translation initiation factor IF-2 subunit beta [Candidatus Pacearchaeota archaeon]HIH17382.1 translation initiation factor IF-2 subunit beta [Nanoarchaeota archaeon]HIH34708.1 translation initiation factor IF-2 subunit beta [Nanoarchaeota archaeon]HIH51160.1 translation initiation factor IF-2 subunit beta [Nanoarchaeota archaeon]
MKYEELLDRALKQMPEKQENSGERFEIPRAQSRIEGNKTFLENFSQIVSTLRRDSVHLLKFLSRELAAPAQVDERRLIFVGKIGAERISQKIEAYAREFVICRECGKPDTEFVKKQRFLFVHCLACGAEHSVRAKIV